MLYFAYGSNLNHAHFEKLCPAAISLGRTELRDYRLVFRRFADIEPAPGTCVAGGLWRITPRCEEALDFYEEVSRGLYRRVTLTLRRPGGQEVKALSYRMTTTIYECPTDAYLALIVEGYADFGIDTATLKAAAAKRGEEETPGLNATRPDA